MLMKRDLNAGKTRYINANRFKLVEMLKNETKLKKNPKKTSKNAPAFLTCFSCVLTIKRGFLFPG
jgi:hypothetical protein